MKKVMILFLLLGCVAQPLQASSTYADGRSDRNVFVRTGIVVGRGTLNMIGMPAELVRSTAAEIKMHKWLWPVTFAPRTVTNIFTRAVSAFYDIVFMPMHMPFTDDLTPLTEPMGLSEYPWQMEGDGF